jgi:hypothetical protein
VSDELRECPFCGKTFSSSYQLGSGQFGYGCNEADCGCEVNGYKSREEAFTAWNTRPLEQALETEVATLEYKLAAAQAEAAKYKALWESVPWDDLWTLSALDGTWRTKGGGRIPGVSKGTRDRISEWLRSSTPQPARGEEPTE